MLTQTGNPDQDRSFPTGQLILDGCYLKATAMLEYQDVSERKLKLALLADLD